MAYDVTDYESDQIAEPPGLADEMDPLGLRKKRRLGDLLDDKSGQVQPDQALLPPLANRINDDKVGKSGSPSSPTAGAPAPYEDPGKGRLADLMKQRSAMDAPKPKASIGSVLKKLAPTLAQGGVAGLAAAFGGMGGPVGADQELERGVQRRQQEQDLVNSQKRQDKVRLDEEIEQENRGVEQRTFQHGEDQDRLRVQEEGMTSRAKLAETAEDARSRRLSDTIEAQNSRLDKTIAGRSDLEDQQAGHKMELQAAKAKAQMSIAQWKQGHPSAQKIPPVLGKAFATYQTSQSRMDVMESSYKDAINDPGNSQAMINLLANHLGMTMGLQPGARMNQAIIQEAMKSGYIDERIEAHFGPDGYLTGVVLTPRQMKQMMGLAESRLMEDARAVTSTEAYFGVQGHAPITPRVPSQATGAGGGGAAGGAGATSDKPPTDDIPKPPREPDPGKKWQYNRKTKQFREVAIVATK